MRRHRPAYVRGVGHQAPEAREWLSITPPLEDPELVRAPWLFHLDVGERAQIHSALGYLCDCLSSCLREATLIEMGGATKILLPRPVRIEGRRRIAKLQLFHDGMTMEFPAIKASRFESVKIGDWAQGATSLDRVLPAVIRIRNEFEARDPHHRELERTGIERLHRILRGYVELLYVPWRLIWISACKRGEHAMTVWLQPGRLRCQLNFAVRPQHRSVGVIPRGLADVLDDIAAKGIHVHEPDRRNGLDPTPHIRIGESLSFYLHNDGCLFETMRAMRAVQLGSGLVMPNE